MKKMIAVLIGFMLLSCLVGCNGVFGMELISSAPPTAETELKTETEPSDAQEETTLPSSDSDNTVTESTDASADSTEVTEKVEPSEPESPSISTQIDSEKYASAVPAASYYQYSCLSDTEKKIYDAIVQGIQAGTSNVDVSAYNCSVDTVSDVYTAVLSDYPQFFYANKNFAYAYSSSTEAIKQIILFYFDGSNFDGYNESGELIKSADREVISRQITEFNDQIDRIVNSISPDLSDFEKEKWIYEYLQNTIEYDTEAASEMLSSSSVTSHAFDVYGAACEGKAVCEGYAELFQYLCYCVGINATPVYGTVSGATHMWNAVCLDNEWYMADATWDDSGKEGLYCYSYFNVTEEEISRSHDIDDETLQVPPCTATAYAYYHWYALYIESTSEAPANYQKVIDDLSANGGQYLCIYIGNQTGNLQRYIQQYILSSKSELQKYIASSNYTVSFESTYYAIGSYYYIPVEKS